MRDFFKKATERWQDGINLLLGVWLFLSPWLLGFADISAALWNALVFGALIVALAALAIVEYHDWEEWADMAIGLWVAVSPWVLGFAALTSGEGAAAFAATWNALVTGVLTLGLAAWALFGRPGQTQSA